MSRTVKKKSYTYKVNRKMRPYQKHTDTKFESITGMVSSPRVEENW